MSARELDTDEDGPDRVWTYFAYDGDAIKIGKSVSPKFRCSRLQCGNPRKVVMVGVIEGDCEFDLHEMFDDYRISGEWFKVDRSIVAVIKERCFVNFAHLSKLEADIAAGQAA